MTEHDIRPLAVGDLPAVRRLNAQNVPEVGPLDRDREQFFLSDDVTAWVVTLDGSLGGWFVGMFDGVAYASPNYRWFSREYDRFAYIDRIALAPDARGRGLADAIYDRWTQVAMDAGRTRLCAEVNTVPANPRSLAFHRRRGFLQVAEEAPYGGVERVAMLTLQVAA